MVSSLVNKMLKVYVVWTGWRQFTISLRRWFIFLRLALWIFVQTFSSDKPFPLNPDVLELLLRVSGLGIGSSYEPAEKRHTGCRGIPQGCWRRRFIERRSARSIGMGDCVFILTRTSVCVCLFPLNCWTDRFLRNLIWTCYLILPHLCTF